LSKYRKKPVVISAWQFGTEEPKPAPYWLTRAIETGKVYYQGGAKPYMTVETLEGNMVANQGDWLICGVTGEIYPCKPEIFAMTYEQVE
jgi:hypothetical protein